MFKTGDTVQNRLNSKLATITEVLKKDGMLRVRFDGDNGTVDLHESRFRATPTVNIQTPFPYVDPETFKKGDYIQVTESGGEPVRGAALSDLNTFGYANFDVLTDDGQYLEFNNNYVTVQVLFRADIARGQTPKY